MIVDMARVQIWGLKDHLPDLIALLHEEGCIQIDDVGNIPDAVIQPFSLSQEMREEQEEVDLLIANINGLIEMFKGLTKERFKNHAIEPIDLFEIKDKVDDVTSKIQYLNNRKKALQDELISFSKYLEMLKIIAPVCPETSKDSGNATIRALVHSSQTRTMNLLAQQLKLLTHGKFEMVNVKVGGETNAVIGIFPLELVSQVETFMRNEKVTQLLLPEEYAYLSTDEALDNLNRKIALNHDELRDIDARLERIAAEWLPQLGVWQLVCKDKVDEFAVYEKVGETDYTFSIFGWLPEHDLNSFGDIIEQNFGEAVSVTEIEVPKKIRASIPVEIKNPKAVKPYENFVKMRATPDYGDVDPSMLVAIFMPIFFGMMAGDVGYGIVMLAIALLLGKKVKSGMVADILKFLRLGAIWTIVFGVLFGEYFGTLGEKLGILPLWMNRSEPENIFPLLIMAISVGVGHIIVGLLIGIWNAFIHKARNHMLERLGMFIGLVGLIFLAGSLTKYLPGGFIMAGWVVLAVGLIVLGISLGTTGIFLGPIEFVGLIGSILSYLRIAALGLASVFLAKVANDLGGMVGSAVIGVLIAVLIHALNIMMGILSPTIQSLRLQYVEFFRRFFEGGHSPFTPFHKRIHFEKKVH